MTVSVAQLRHAKNAVIGSPSAKRAVAQDDSFVRLCVDALSSQLEIRIEAAHVISSLSYGSPPALAALLRAGAHQALLYAISRLRPTDPAPLCAAFTRALRALTVSLAELVGPHHWGLSPDYSKASIRNDAKNALDLIFQTDSLDVYLPLLSSSLSTSTPTPASRIPASASTSIAQLLASGIRTDAHRTAVTEWLPPSERAKEVRSNGSRRWEKASATSANSSAKYGGWVAMALTGLIKCKDVKLQEAVLYALANLAKDNLTVSLALAKHSLTVIQLAKSRPTEIKLAASLWYVSLSDSSPHSYCTPKRNPHIPRQLSPTSIPHLQRYRRLLRT
ncbi:hypothetical protein AX14_012356 [Amanita brunnescens Koide BX004]|nr:hypothetical protein AX14_013078 [Amanita brunnescens Koide BX004]KAF8716427.1 hypothetical protein AX14_012356 [Amanita brunnescens Koide BX004]